MNDLTSIFAKNLCALRKREGLTQDKFSELIGVGLRSLQTYEGAERLPNTDIIEHIAKVCRVESYTLFQPKTELDKVEDISSIFTMLSDRAEIIQLMAQLPDDSIAWKGVKAMIEGALPDLDNKSCHSHQRK